MMVEGLSNVSAYQGQGSSVASVAPVEISVDPVEASPAPVKDAPETQNAGKEAPGGGQQPSQAALKKAVEQINAKANSAEAIFGIHEKTNRVTIKMVDKNTKEVIREFPAEETLDLIAKAWELAGIMVDEKR